MKFGYIDNSLRVEWESLVAKKPESGFMQTFFYSEFKRLTGWETFKIGIFENEKIIGGAVVMKFYYGDTSFLYIPEGPVLSYDVKASEEYFNLLIKEIYKLVLLDKRHSTTHLRIEPRLQKLPSYFKDFTKAPLNMEPKQTLMIDLRFSEKDLLTSMKPKGRYNIKVARKYGVKVKSYNNPSVLKIFLDVYHQTKTRKNFKGKQDIFSENLVPLLLNDKKGKIYTAEYEGKALAVALVVFFGERVSYFFGGSVNTDKEKMAPYLLHWKIIKEAKKAGFRWYDFWGIAEDEEDTKDSWHGFTKFKRQFGGQRFDFIGTYDLVYNKKLYEKFLKESGEDLIK